MNQNGMSDHEVDKDVINNSKFIFYVKKNQFKRK